MSVIIRLQGLAWTASAMNIRHFFHGLNIPAGGVHIIGGEGGDAFIAFSSDEDARVAMKMNLSLLNGVPVQLFLSSKSEMQSVIDAARSGSSTSSQTAASQAVPSAQAVMATGAGQVAMGGGGVNPMAAKAMGGVDQMQQMSGFAHTQNQGQAGMMGSKDNFMMMQQQQSAMAGGVGGGGMNARGNWQGHAGMMGQIDNQNQNNMNMPYNSNNFQPNMMGSAGQRQNDQFSRFSNMQQQPSMSDSNSFQGFGQNSNNTYGGRQGQGPETKLDPVQSGPARGMMMPGQNLYGNPGGMGPGSARGASAESEKHGQVPVTPNVDKIVQGLVPGQRAGSKAKDNIAGGVLGGDQRLRGMEDVGRSSLPKDRYDASPLSMDAARAPAAGARSWGADTGAEGSFSNQSRFPPEMGRDHVPSQSLSREDQFYKREGRRRPNRFAEKPETEESPAGVGGMQAKPPAFPDGEGRLPNQYRGRQESGRFSDMGQGYPDRERGKPPASMDDGAPSTRYPPEDEEPETDRMAPGPRGPMERHMDNYRGMADETRANLPMDRRFPNRDNQRDFYGDHRGGFQDARPGFPDEQRSASDTRGRDMFDDPSQRAMPDDRGFRPRRFDRDEPPRGEQRDPPGRFPPEENRGYPRYPPDSRFEAGMERDDRFPDRPGPNGERRMHGGDHDNYPPRGGGGEGRPMADDRPDMWPGERRRADEMMGRRPGDNPFPPEDQRYRDREDELRREAFERGFRGPEDRFMPGRGRGAMRGMGRPDSDGYGMRPMPPDQRAAFPDRPGRFREGDREPYPYGPDEYSDGPGQRKPFDRMPDKDRPDIDGPRPGLLNTPDGPRYPPADRGPMVGNMETGDDPMDMDQRFDREMDMGPGPGARRPPGTFRDSEGSDYGHGPPMDEGYGRGGPPRDFDSGPRGRGGPFMDRGGRGRGDPFGRGRPGGMPPFGRGRGGRDADMYLEEQGMMGQDVDNRMVDGRFPNAPPADQPPGMPDKPPAGPMARGLLGDSPGDIGNKKPDPKMDVDKRDIDSRPPRRSDDRDRDRRYNDDRRSNRDDRDRYSYRARYDRDRERDRDRRRSRSRSRDRSRDRDSRYSRDNRDRSSKDKASRGDSPKADGSKSVRPSKYLIVKNMPKTVAFRDIRRFFHPMDVPFDGIKLINDEKGDRVGEAFVYFYRHEDAVRAFRKNGERMEGRPLTISYSTEIEFQKAIDSYVPPVKLDAAAPKPPVPTPNKPAETSSSQSDKIRYIVQMKLLPLTITRQDIANFFKNLKIENNGEAAYIEFDQEGVATGVSFVEFKTDIDYKKALTHDGNLLSAKNVRVLPGRPDEADKLKAVQGEMFQRAALRNIANKATSNSGPKPPSQAAQTPATPAASGLKPLVPPVASNDQGNLCVHIQGLPLLATPHDIREFFSECQIAPRGINIAHDGAGKPLGEGFVEFVSKAEVDKALKKDKTSLGRHIVAVKPIKKKEMFDRLENAKGRGGVPPKISSPVIPTSQSQSNSSPAKAPFNSSLHQAPPKPHHIPQPPHMQDSSPRTTSNSSTNPSPSQQPNQPRHPAPHQQSQMNPPQQQQAPNKPPPSQSPMNPPPKPPGPDMAQDQGHPPPMQKPMGGGPGGPGGPVGPPLVMAPGGGKSFPPGVLNNNWFYLRCQNFPTDISIAEIMQFFHTYRAIGESVRLHYSSEGQPTGNAVVGFSSAEDANRALQRLNTRMCRHSTINLHPA